MFTSSLLLAAGVVLGLGWVVVQTPAKAAPRTIDEGLVLLFGSLVGSRIGFVWIHWPYYRLHLGETPQVWLGGLSAEGALAGAAASLLILTIVTRQPVGLLADRHLPLGIVVATAGWVAGWWGGSGYGPLAEGQWWGLPVRDESGIYARRLPVQLIGAVVGLGIYWFLDKLRMPARRGARAVPGRAAAWWFLTLALQLLALGFVRADPGLVWLGLRVDIWAAGGLCVAAVLCLIGVYWLWRARRA